MNLNQCARIGRTLGAAGLVLLSPLLTLAGVQAANAAPVFSHLAWTPDTPNSEIGLRDPSIFDFEGRSVIVSGTSKLGLLDNIILEYPSLDEMTRSSAVQYVLTVLDKDGEPVHRANFCWDTLFHQWSSGELYMYCTLAEVSPDSTYDHSQPPAHLDDIAGCDDEQRRLYAFAPLPGATTANGFPLTWKILKQGHPVYGDGEYCTSPTRFNVAGAHIVENIPHPVQLGIETFDDVLFSDSGGIVGRGMRNPLEATNAGLALLKPGTHEALDARTWDSHNPYPSEIAPQRDPYPFSIIEGARPFFNPNDGYWYVLYSDGDCCDVQEDTYGVMLARAVRPNDITGPYLKAVAGADVKTLVNSVIDAGGVRYRGVGRAFPYIDAQGNTRLLVHGENPIDNPKHQDALLVFDVPLDTLTDYCSAAQGCSWR